jgi:hypothetical protein
VEDLSETPFRLVRAWKVSSLQNKGVRCWFAPHDVQGGKKLHEQIDEAIRRYERRLLILSPNSMSSKWVKTEIRNSRKREVAEKKRVLFPVRLASYEALREWKLFDGDEGEDLATEIREYYIPDSASGRITIRMCGSLRNCCGICGRKSRSSVPQRLKPRSFPWPDRHEWNSCPSRSQVR